MFAISEARDLLQHAMNRIDQLIVVRADIAELETSILGGTAGDGAVPDLKGMEARLHEGLEWFGAQGIELKGFAPFLLDFPTRLSGVDLLLCWLEGEDDLAWYHRPEHGFPGRRPLDELDG